MVKKSKDGKGFSKLPLTAKQKEDLERKFISRAGIPDQVNEYDKKNITLSIRLTPRMVHDLDDIADLNGIPRSTLISLVLRKFIEGKEKILVE